MTDKELIAALEAERERCVKVAEKFQDQAPDSPFLKGWNKAIETVAAAIRRAAFEHKDHTND